MNGMLQVKAVIGAITDIGLMLLGLAIIAEIVFGLTSRLTTEIIAAIIVLVVIVCALLFSNVVRAIFFESVGHPRGQSRIEIGATKVEIKRL